MKYTMKSNYISFNKMKNNECHVEVRLFDKKRQQLKIGDVIEFVNSRTQEKLLTQLRGIAIFENFEDMVDYLTPQLLGYDNKDELMLRFERLYPADMVSKFNLVGLFVKNMTAELLEKARNEKLTRHPERSKPRTEGCQRSAARRGRPSCRRPCLPPKS